MSFEIRRIGPDELPTMYALLDTFGEVFGMPETYCALQPAREYLRQLLDGESFIALAAMADGRVVGGLAAYVLPKFEQARSEIHLYDLAVAASHRRQGIATALVAALRGIAAERGAYLIFVQADTGPEDVPAITLYSRLGRREEVLHFDIEVDPGPG